MWKKNGALLVRVPRQEADTAQSQGLGENSPQLVVIEW